MTTTQLLIAIILVELLVIVGLVLVGVLYLAGRRNRRERNAIDELASTIRDNRSSRRDELRQICQEQFGYSGADLEHKVVELLNAERRFYERLLDLYLNRDPELIRQLNGYLDEVLDSYTSIEPAVASEIPPQAADDAAGGTAGEQADEQGGAEPARPESGVEPGSGVDRELALHRHALNRVFAEYTSMFGIRMSKDRELSAREILERMESGQLEGGDGDDGEPEQLVNRNRQ